ncbi:MAG TPA: PLDc N-terminal domain-containing protein [Candidatus Thermoplasmatota archaeon]|nr:PLDc N-terminal domain-containing protein [Candidatus Thermoplasmatota archaeon]
MFPSGPFAVVPTLLQGKAGPSSFGVGGSILGLVVLVLDILVIVSILKSHKALLVKVAWILVVVFLPILGLILYFFLGREK